jgi:fimbrial chaperone protein
MMLRHAILGLSLALLAPAEVSAGAFRFSPVNVEIPSNQRTTTVTLINTDTVTLNFQIRLFKWTQVDGQDRLEPADEMLVSPPAITLLPGKSYLVRIARRDSGPVGGERAYRLLIDQLSPPEQDDEGNRLGVSILYRASLPVYLTDPKAEARLGWRVREDADGLHVAVHNSGSRHARIAQLALQPADGSPPISFANGSLLGVVLAGNSSAFTFKPTQGEPVPKLAKGSRVVLTAVDGGVPKDRDGAPVTRAISETLDVE